MVSFLAVGVGLDLNPWDWFWIGLWGPRVAIGLVLGVHLGLVLDWFWAGIRPKTLIRSFFARGKKKKKIS